MRYVLVLLLLAGCVHLTPQQKAERDMAKYGPACETYGFSPHTPEFGNCVLQLKAHGIAAIGAIGAIGAAQGANAQMQQNMRQATQPK